MTLKRDYTVHFKVSNSDYGLITIPKGTRVTNKTAIGIDKNYHFVDDFSWVKTIDGIPQYGLLHDLQYHGLNVPKEYINKV